MLTFAVFQLDFEASEQARIAAEDADIAAKRVVYFISFFFKKVKLYLHVLINTL
jgi:hypothetical protein